MMKIDVLGFAGCPNFAPALERTRAVVERTGIKAEVRAIDVPTDAAAKTFRFLGSPTVRVNGLDVEEAAQTLSSFGFGCRTYLVNGERQGLPPQAWIEDAIREALQNESI